VLVFLKPGIRDWDIRSSTNQSKLFSAGRNAACSCNHRTDTMSEKGKILDLFCQRCLV